MCPRTRNFAYNREEEGEGIRSKGGGGMIKTVQQKQTKTIKFLFYRVSNVIDYSLTQNNFVNHTPQIYPVVRSSLVQTVPPLDPPSTYQTKHFQGFRVNINKNLMELIKLKVH